MKTLIFTAALTMAFTAQAAVAAETTSLDAFFAKDGIVTTEANYPTLETSRQLLKYQDAVGVNKLYHIRDLANVKTQVAVRTNQDTYYSFTTINVENSATLTLPKVAEGMYISAQVITEDHQIKPMVFGSGMHLISGANIKDTHVVVVVRLDARIPKKEANAIQDQMYITSKSDAEYVSPVVNKEIFHQVEVDLKTQFLAMLKAEGADALTGMFTSLQDGSKEMRTDQKYSVGAAVGWGGAQFIDNIYEISPNYAMTCHQATFEDPQNKQFWSVTVYDKAGFMFEDKAKISSHTVKPNGDGTITLSFGCGADAINNLKVKNDTGVFSLTFRHYSPSQKVMDGYRLVPLVKLVK
ncbi:DUF1214 domain-containing protein [Thalassotalea nanhaiensis]|uniref:DUF1214 domain-containing protein n=1 Tax=Thalassotalea nanhaiensis TaxID=3065648 RepID=A0ABY9TGD6_9GAMM|nr:DUF1214 domain-containing protein [Colwelliaceae bacterium SQ345]